MQHHPVFLLLLCVLIAILIAPQYYDISFVQCLTTPCTDMTKIHGACSSSSSLQSTYSPISSASTQSSLITSQTDYLGNMYMLSTAVNNLGSLSFQSYQKGVVTKVSAGGSVTWTRNINDCGNNGTVRASMLNSNAILVFAGSVSYTGLSNDLCLLTSMSVTMSGSSTNRTVYYISSIDSSNNVLWMYSLDQFYTVNVSPKGLAHDKTDNTIVGHVSYSATNQTLSVDGVSVTVMSGYNSLISKFSYNGAVLSLTWSTSICYSTSSSGCTILSVLSDTSIDDMIVALVSISGSVTMGGQQVTSLGKQPNVYIVVLSTTGVIQYMRNFIYSNDILSNKVEAVLSLKGQLYLTSSCFDTCYIMGSSVSNPGITLTSFNVFKASIDWSKMYVSLSSSSIGRVSSLSMDSGGNLYSILIGTTPFSIVDFITRSVSYTSPTTLFVKQSSVDGTIYWIQTVATSYSNIIISASTYTKLDTSVSSQMQVSVFYNQYSTNQLFSVDRYLPCVSPLVVGISNFKNGGPGGSSYYVSIYH